uniref:Ribonuclease III n=1 Tax=Marseillevirus LCMAC201 TaxID=2506605 RepID=A0A481YXL3_9VIRU|nr:MAG: ribonuclease III [Marseillevirus LCMAC201]
MDTSTFRTFIQAQLKIARINKEHREIFTDSDAMKLFLTAFTDPTYDAKNNYQTLEFIGDGIMHAILSQYIPRRFPGLASGESKYSKKSTGEGVLSKTRRFLEQRKTLSDFALKRGFWDHVLADEDTKTKLRKETLENVYEAFVGALVEIVDQRVKQGLGYNYAYNYASASLDDLKIEISKENLDDPITRLNELYKANELKGDSQPLKWGDAAYYTDKLYIPRLDQHPAKVYRVRGNLYFSTKDKVAYVFYDKKWTHVSLVPLMDLRPLKLSEEEPDPDTLQMMWYAGVYGFPDLIGHAPDVILDKLSPNQILKNPDKYSAEIIGQGLHFKKTDSRKLAAAQALHYLHGKGIKK